ncbi:MAG: sulfurtransferase [Gammaproteobacteria bacterium]|nr:sulfurtransferase [Gammaproteobacteria bacterium]NND59771.1 sulfurtransferase [Gammaproteobacteria bacterium]
MDAALISPAEVAPRLAQGDVCLLDVREPWELETAAVDGTLDIPMGEVVDNLDRIRAAAADKQLVVMCRSGARSQQVANFLNENGLSGVLNLDGGILAWSEQVDPTLPTY